ncbi:MAG: cytochrome c [Gammaproteobacteria bacterium]|nr:cytochrome c [Gammaproteobacteria bacterium]
MKTQYTTLLVLAVGANPVFAEDISHGKKLQQENCMSCHDDGMYTRENRKVTTPDGLQKQVRRCEQTLGLQWFDEDIDAVSDYLNDTFYKFK